MTKLMLKPVMNFPIEEKAFIFEYKVNPSENHIRSFNVSTPIESSFTVEPEINTPKGVDLVHFVSLINESRMYSFTGKELKQLIVKSFSGNFDKVSLLLQATGEYIDSNSLLVDVDNMFDKDLIMEKKMNKNLRRTVINNLHLIKRAKENTEKKNIKLNLAEDVAKRFFEYGPEDFKE